MPAPALVALWVKVAETKVDQTSRYGSERDRATVIKNTTSAQATKIVS